MWISRVIDVNFYQTPAHATAIFWNLIFVCITIKDKLIKHLYNSHLRTLPIAHRENSVMWTYIYYSLYDQDWCGVNLYPYQSQSETAAGNYAPNLVENIVSERIQLAINCKLITFCDR